MTTMDVMPRWEPNARDRLTDAALELFVEHGYEATTVAEIADRAGLTKSTFFRHFTDKREVLFGGQDQLTQVFAGAIQGAPAGAGPVACLEAALTAVASLAFPQERHEFATTRRGVIDANSELQERELLKLDRTAEGVTAALMARGIDDVTARLTAGIAVLAFGTAFERWTDPGNEQPFEPLARAALTDLLASAAGLAGDATT